MAAHVLTDCFTVEGAAVLWPFPMKRVAIGNLYHIDALLTLPLLVTLVRLAFLTTKKQIPRRRKLNAWGLGLAAAYMLLSIGMKFLAATGFEADLARRELKFQRRMEAPTPFNIVLWRSVVDRGDSFLVGYRTVFESRSNPVRWTVYPKGKTELEDLEAMREVKLLQESTDGWWIARRHATGAWIGDLRFCEARSWGDKKTMVDSRMARAWDVYAEKDHGEKVREILPDHYSNTDMLGRMASRIFGNREAWEANPRLAGVTGSLPEFLAAEE
jgi:inner membrane protein